SLPRRKAPQPDADDHADDQGYPGQDPALPAAGIIQEAECRAPVVDEQEIEARHHGLWQAIRQQGIRQVLAELVEQHDAGDQRGLHGTRRIPAAFCLQRRTHAETPASLDAVPSGSRMALKAARASRRSHWICAFRASRDSKRRSSRNFARKWTRRCYPYSSGATSSKCTSSEGMGRSSTVGLTPRLATPDTT